MAATTQESLNTNVRYAVTFAAGLFTGPMASLLFDAQQIKDIVDSLQVMGQAAQQFIGASYKLIAVVGPVVGAWMAWLGVKSGSFDALVARIKRQPESVTVAANDPKAAPAVVEAMLVSDHVKGVVTTDAVSRAIPSDKVQSTASALPQSVQ